jgi:hypothetical protein
MKSHWIHWVNLWISGVCLDDDLDSLQPPREEVVGCSTLGKPWNPWKIHGKSITTEGKLCSMIPMLKSDSSHLWVTCHSYGGLVQTLEIPKLQLLGLWWQPFQHISAAPHVAAPMSGNSKWRRRRFSRRVFPEWNPMVRTRRTWRLFAKAKIETMAIGMWIPNSWMVYKGKSIYKWMMTGGTTI